ncbi:MAG TPA: ATP-dependent DNA helicase [Terriglobales bacterium]|nr:ATP-dependent DNA helicase [Terriglobales bacterium]
MAVAKATSRLREFTPDPSQQEAIEHVHGPMLVIAGAGTGKTTVLTKRLAHLISQGHARATEILAVTYTRNAAQEMRDRVRKELPGADLSGLRIATFHEYCNTLLQQIGRQFGVLDDQDLWIYLRRRIRELHLNHFVRAANVSKFLDDLLGFIRRCHDELVGPEKYQQYVQSLERGELPIPRVTRSKDVQGLSDDEVLGRCREISSVFATVERMLREDNLGTFGHMVTRAHGWLQQEGENFTRPRFILVDEFQDVNFAQVKVLQQLAGKERNVFAVGDPDQAIYHFRGASSAAFLLFQRHFEGAKLVRLGKNRRSTSPILNSAFALISRNPNLFDSGRGSTPLYHRAPLVSAREEEAARESIEIPRVPVEVVVLTAKDTEFAEVTRKLRDWHRKSHCRWSDCAVLYRTHIHRDQVAAELARQGIPFSIENMDVMDMPEARDLFACLGAVVSDADAASLFRVAALPQFAIDPEKLRAGIRALPRDPGNSAIASVLSKIEGGPAVLACLQKTRADIATAGALGRAALDIMVRNFDLDRNSRALNAVLDFAIPWQTKPVTKTGAIGELLEYLEYFREAGGVIPLSSNDENAVRLMTAHAAKGLEFAHVVILRANSNSFPASYKETLLEFPRELHDPASIAQSDDKELSKQEERRLFYVAMTRARDGLTIYAKQGTGVKDATPPGFMRDLLKDPGLRDRWLVGAQARGFQTDMFAAAAGPQPMSRTSEWLSLPPASNLHSRLSASAVQTYETCPLQFKLDREWKIPGEVPAAMQYGAVMHRVLRAYYDSVRLERPMADDVLIQLFRDDLAQAGFQDRYQHDLYRRQGEQQLQDFLAACRRTPAPRVLHTEEFFDVKVGDVNVAGRIDRIDQLAGDEVAITDYKTGKAQSQEDSDESLQLSIYAMAAREKWGYRARHLVLYNLEGNSPVVTQRSDFQLEEAKGRILKVAESVAAGNFEPKPGFYCKFCAYRNLCSATEKRLQERPD